MRFGDEFCRSQSPQWSSFYIAYDELKTSIKIEHGKASAANRQSNVAGKSLVLVLCGIETLTAISHIRRPDSAMPESRKALSHRELAIVRTPGPDR
jgi:hypothetical protein